MSIVVIIPTDRDQRTDGWKEGKGWRILVWYVRAHQIF